MALNPEQVAFVVLTLPNEELVLQRRHGHTHFENCLGFYGGGIEVGESPLEALQRELTEETDLQPSELQLKSLDRFVLEVSPRRVLEFHAFIGRVSVHNFIDTDGGSPENYSLNELNKRTDLTPGSRAMLDRLNERNTQWH